MNPDTVLDERVSARSVVIHLMEAAVVGVVTAVLISMGTIKIIETKIDHQREADAEHTRRLALAEAALQQHSAQIIQLQTQAAYTAQQLQAILDLQRDIADTLTVRAKR